MKALSLHKFYQLPAACNNSSNVASLRSDATAASVSVKKDDAEDYDEECKSTLILYYKLFLIVTYIPFSSAFPTTRSG